MAATWSPAASHPPNTPSPVASIGSSTASPANPKSAGYAKRYNGRSVADERHPPRRGPSRRGGQRLSARPPARASLLHLSPGQEWWRHRREENGEDPMPQAIDIDEIRPLLTDGAHLSEVLPPDEFEEEHLPGAINLPLKQLTEQATASLAKARP